MLSPMTTKSPFAFTRPASDAAELFIFGDIGESWSAHSVSAAQMAADLAALPASVSTIHVRINSYGGSVADGLAIYNALRAHAARVVVSIEGVAASVASLIAMAGDEVQMHAASLVMVHAPWANATGNAPELREFAALLDTYATAMATAYARKTGRPAVDITRDWLAGGDHWFTALEAIAAGLADTVIEASADTAATPPAPEPSFARGLARYTHNAPMRIAAALTGEVPMHQAVSPAAADHPVASDRESVLAELRRRNDEIRAMVRDIETPHVQRVLAACLADPTLTTADAGHRILRALGAGVEPVGGGFDTLATKANPGDFLEAAADALLIRAGLRVASPHPAARDLHGMSLADLARTCVSRSGRTLLGRDSIDSLVRAAHGTSDFPLLLANSANKALQMGFEAEPASHRAWVRTVEVNDFKTQSRVQRSEAPGLLEVLENGEFTYGTFGERQEQYAISTYGRIFQISRQAMINDDLGAFTTLPAAFGAAAARLEADKVYSVLTTNAEMSDSVALFHTATHGNLAGTPAALSATSLGVARAAMRKQMGQSGLGYLNVIPKFLIVPAALETAAEILVASTVKVGGSNPEPNAAFIRSLTVVVDPRLDAASATAWYLAADPAQIDTVELGYLRGQRGVFVEDEVDFNTDAMRLKARLDFGVKALDWRGLYKNAGA